MRTGTRGLALIQRYERLRLEAYLPTPEDVPTIGWGHTRGVRLGDMCTREQADAWLAEDIAEAEAAVNAIDVPLTQAMFDALVSLAFNVGTAALDPGHLIGRELRAGEHIRAWRGFALWVKQGGRVLRGLCRRRAEEMALFVEDSAPGLLG